MLTIFQNVPMSFDFARNTCLSIHLKGSGGGGLEGEIILQHVTKTNKIDNFIIKVF